jgi:subtilase family serine protease
MLNLLYKKYSKKLLIVAAGLLTGAAAFAQTAGKPVLITQPVNAAKTVTLTGNTRPEAIAANDLGAVPDSFQLPHMLLQLQRSAQQQQALDTLIDQLHDTSSASYGHWLTAEQFSQFGLNAQDLNTVTAWLSSQGFVVNVVYTNGILIDFSGTAGQVHQAFQTEIHNLNVNGKHYIANMSDPKIPAALAPAVVGVVSLNNFPAHANVERRPDYTVTVNEEYLVAPGDLQTIYNFTPAYKAGLTGKGETITVVEDTDVYATSDFTTFQTTFGLSSFGGTLKTVHPAPPSGTNNCTDPGVNGDDFEAAVDTQWALAAAPAATIQLASCPTTTSYGFFIAVQNLVNSATPPTIISMSYGVCETLLGATQNAAINKAYEQAVTEGVSVFVAAGDFGAACNDHFDGNGEYAKYGISESGFTTTPYNVSVGGTDFGTLFNNDFSTYWRGTNTKYYESALSYMYEVPWNDSCASALVAAYLGDPQTGAGSLCNTSTGQSFPNTVAGSGGPSGCATGTPSTPPYVSGTCKGYAKPKFQAGVLGIPADSVRDIPDVSLFASNGWLGSYYPVCYTDPSGGGTSCAGAPSTWAGAGGTSFGAPIMAAVQSLINEKTGKRSGNPNGIYYKLAAAEYGASGSSACNSNLGNGVASTCIFYDVTSGDMDLPCKGKVDCYVPTGYGNLSTSDTTFEPAYGTTTGYDLATGLGSINVYNLITAYAKAVAQ